MDTDTRCELIEHLVDAARLAHEDLSAAQNVALKRLGDALPGTPERDQAFEDLVGVIVRLQDGVAEMAVDLALTASRPARWAQQPEPGQDGPAVRPVRQPGPDDAA